MIGEPVLSAVCQCHICSRPCSRQFGASGLGRSQKRRTRSPPAIAGETNRLYGGELSGDCRKLDVWRAAREEVEAERDSLEQIWSRSPSLLTCVEPREFETALNKGDLERIVAFCDEEAVFAFSLTKSTLARPRSAPRCNS